MGMGTRPSVFAGRRFYLAGDCPFIALQKKSYMIKKLEKVGVHEFYG